MSNPEYEAYGSKRMRWVEKDEPGEFRDANEYLHGSRLAHITGYYCDEFCDETAVPAVYALRADCAACADPSRTTDCADCETCGGSGDIFTYYPAVRDPSNDGCGIVDFEESYADAEEAARAAHGLAERYADVEREYNENETSKLNLENLKDDVRELRNRHRYMIRALPEAGDDATGARMREEVRTRLTQLVKDIRELRSNINWSL